MQIYLEYSQWQGMLWRGEMKEDILTVRGCAPLKGEQGAQRAPRLHILNLIIYMLMTPSFQSQ